MQLFRSEEHLQRWLEERSVARGATMTLAQQWELAKHWYSDRLEPTWQRRTPDEARRVFATVGLNGEFWEL